MSDTELGKEPSKELNFLVEWNGEDDPENPRNYSLAKKLIITIAVSQIAFCLTTCSSLSSAGAISVAQDFAVKEYLGDLTTGLYFIGFGVGVTPIGPLSEIYGRNVVYHVTFLISNLFTLGCALAPNIQTLLVCRFFAGVFGAAPLSNSGGSLADISDPLLRSWLFPAFTVCAYIGPALAPLIGGFIDQSHLGWRWIYWVAFIYSCGIMFLCMVFLPETNHFIILERRAKKLQKETGQNEWYTNNLKVTPMTLVKAVFMPVWLLFTEPIVLFCNFYITIAYIIFFGDLESYGTVFLPYGITQGQLGLMFLPIVVGFVLCGATTPIIVRHYQRVAHHFQGKVPPEVRILPMLLVSPLLPIALFWIGWTSYPFISLWCPAMSGLVFGFAFLFVFIAIYQYLIDSYEQNAATVLSSITLARYWASGVWVVFVRQIYHNLGTHWAFSMLGFLAAAMIPVTWCFFRYGKDIRKRSKYTGHHAEEENADYSIVSTIWM